MDEAPRDGTYIIGFYGDDEVEVCWAESRKCILADVAPGAGRFGPGWEDKCNGLYVDAPDAWKPIEPVDLRDQEYSEHGVGGE